MIHPGNRNMLEITGLLFLVQPVFRSKTLILHLKCVNFYVLKRKYCSVGFTFSPVSVLFVKKINKINRNYNKIKKNIFQSL